MGLCVCLHVWVRETERENGGARTDEQCPKTPREATSWDSGWRGLGSSSESGVGGDRGRCRHEPATPGLTSSRAWIPCCRLAE
jgi:hypothetical protein